MSSRPNRERRSSCRPTVPIRYPVCLIYRVDETCAHLRVINDLKAFSDSRPDVYHSPRLNGIKIPENSSYGQLEQKRH